jgi:peptide deformylase
MDCQCVSILALGDQNQIILHQKTTAVKKHEMKEAQNIGQRLINTLKALPTPAAGLAAPQIRERKSVFVYSYDRNPEHLEVVVNPTIAPIGEERVEGWEGCLSVANTRQIALIKRYSRIFVTYVNPSSRVTVRAYLEGFAAKVFQHEYDHLQGVLNITKEGAVVKAFDSDEKFKMFMAEVKAKDATVYVPPNFVTPPRL